MDTFMKVTSFISAKRTEEEEDTLDDLYMMYSESSSLQLTHPFWSMSSEQLLC